jgi:ADP-ribose pyrophosphatase
VFTEKTIDIQNVFNGQVFQVEVQTVEMPDQRHARREIVRHGGGACILAVDDARNVYLVRQYRIAFASELLEVPAGKLEPGETPEACARRELAEETGLRANHIERLASMYPTPGYCSEVLHIFLATGLVEGEAAPDDGEHLICQAYPLEDVLAMIDRGEIADAKTQIALLSLYRRLTVHTG